MAKSDDEDAYLYGLDEEQQPQPADAPADTAAPAKAPEPAAADDDDDDEEEYDESDDDIDIIIGDAPITAASGTETATEGTKEESAAPASGSSAQKPQESALGVDVNAVAEYEGKPLTQVDLETLKEKPWRAPGVDITDYFNYGFDEFSWTYYCSKQDKLRGEFNPQKVFAQLMGTKPGSGGPPMPPMMGMPMMAGMPSFPGGAPPPMPFGQFGQGGNFQMPPPPPPPPLGRR